MRKLFDKIRLLWQTYFARIQQYGIAIAILLIGILISFAVFRLYRAQDFRRTRAEFEHIADLRLYMIKDLLLGTLEQIKFIEQFYYSSEEVTPEEFQTFIHHSFVLYPNILGIGWLLENSTKPAPNNRSPKLQFSDREEIKRSFPFTYLETAYPFSLENDHYLKFNEGLKKSRQNPLTATILSKLFFFQNGKRTPGFAIFYPILKNKSSSNKNLKTNLFGTLVCFSNFDNIVQNVRALIEPVGINIGIYDITDKEELLYWSESVLAKEKPSFTTSETKHFWSRNLIFDYGDRIWELQAIPTMEFIKQRIQKPWSHWDVPIIGLLFSSLMASYFLNLVNRRMQIEKEVQERTNDLAAMNQVLHQEIQERKRVEDNFARQQHYLQKRHETLEYLTKLTTSELRSAIHEVILRTASVMQIDRVGVWLYEKTDDTHLLICTGLYILSTNSFSNHLEFSSYYFPFYFNALSKQNPLILPSQDEELNNELSSYLAVFHITSKLDIPIVFEGKLLGILSCEETRGQRIWLMDDRHFGQNIADVIAIMIEQSARRKAEKALQEIEERLRFITQQAIDGIISINDKGEIISWNLGAEKIFGYSEKEIQGKSLQSVILQTNFLDEETAAKPVELKGQHKNGHFFPIEISTTRWKSGEHYTDTIIVRDITARKEKERRLIEDVREAKDANEAKNQFLATISHELRTPLNAIIGFDQCLLIGMDGAINESQRKSLVKIEKSSFQLLNLINDILDLAKIEANRMELDVMPHNIVEIVSSCVEEMQTLAQQKHLSLSFTTQKPFILVELDKVRMRQVILNLLSNAIKFTEKGSIEVMIQNFPNEISVQVIDTGIGLSPEQKSKLFQSFFQADSSITRKYGGTGLGLVISKRIVEFHNGSISVESEKGRGSTFTIILPKTQTSLEKQK